MSGGASSDRFRLAAGVSLVPVAELPAESRRRLGPTDKTTALVRAGSRTGALLIGDELVELVEAFRRPRTLAEAILHYSRRRRRDPQQVLQQTFATLKLLVERRYLVAGEGRGGKRRPGERLLPGDRLGELEIVRTLRRMEDTELFQVRLTDGGVAALKIARAGATEAAARLAREERILRYLAGDPTPEPLGLGEHAGRACLLLEWRTGSHAQAATEEWRRRPGAAARRRLLEICGRIARAYAGLHRRGVIHGDVGPGNILIDPADRVTLLDFEEALRGRAGVPTLFEPEVARAELAGEAPPPASEAGEQYALAALLYELITGAPYLDFDLRWERLLGQIVADPPLGFAARGLPVWPQVEAVLGRSLAKDPAARFASVAEMAAALEAALTDDAPSGAETRAPRAELRRLVDGAVATAEERPGVRASARSRPAPASVYAGAAGVALALAGIARRRGEAALVELADRRLAAATGRLGRPGAFVDPEDPAPVVPVAASLFAGPAGVYAVEAILARQAGDAAREARALASLLAGLRPSHGGLDLLDGEAGALLTAALLLGRSAAEPPVAAAVAGVRLGSRVEPILTALWERLDEQPAIGETTGELGMAHGWAGYLYATLRWCRAAAATPPVELERRLSELAGQALPVGRGLIWPWSLPPAAAAEAFMPGWCNGSAGYVFLWTAAAELLGGGSFLELARGAAWNAWESPQREGSLCCGLVGRAYALVELSRVTGEPLWVERARDLARLAAHEGLFESERRAGLFKSELALALLVSDLERPDSAAFPLLTRLG